ncbi:hypothetical protein JW859_01700 [bacterium]|nr:hypothetical protein [bacterium]
MKTNDNLQILAQGLKEARSATAELTKQLAKLGRDRLELRRRITSACVGGSCTESGASPGTAGTGSAGTALSGALTQSLSSAMRSISTDFTQVLRNALSGLARSLGNLLGRQLGGGGLFSGVLSNLFGGGLSLLVNRLFRSRQRVEVANTVRTEVLNFPAATNLTLAANPASRLFGGRAVARGPSFTVNIDYKNGAEELISAKVAQRLSDLNSWQGVL